MPPGGGASDVNWPIKSNDLVEDFHLPYKGGRNSRTTPFFQEDPGRDDPPFLASPNPHHKFFVLPSMLTRSQRKKRTKSQGASIAKDNDLVSPPVAGLGPAPPKSITVARTPSKAKTGGDKNRRQPNTPSSTKSARSSASTPSRKNEAFNALFRHGLAEDFESNGGLGVLKAKGGHWLERFLNRCIELDKTKSSMAVYGPSHASDHRKKIRGLVERWANHVNAGTYQAKVLEPLGVMPAAFRSKGGKASSSDEDMSESDDDDDDDESSLNSSDRSSYDSSIASTQASASHRNSSIYARNIKASQALNLPAVVSPPPALYKATKTRTRLPPPPAPSFPPKADTMSVATEEQGMISMPLITYDPNSVNPFDTYPFVIGELHGLKGVGRHEGNFYRGYGIMIQIDLHYVEMNQGMKNLFMASIYNENTVRIEGPFVDFILAHQPEKVEFKSKEDQAMDGTTNGDPMMEVLYTHFAKYQELRTANGNRDLPVVWHIQFPSHVRLSAKHIYAQDGSSENSFEKLQLVGAGAKQESAKMNFAADRRYLCWRVSDQGLKPVKRTKHSIDQEENELANMFQGWSM